MFRKILDSPWLYFGLAGLLLAVGLYSQIQFYPPPRPPGAIEDLEGLRDREHLNVVFIVIDMLRADRLSAYGYERQTTPVMDQLASKGIRFANVEAQSSWTKASMASMWTGMYPERTGIQRFFHAMPAEATMPAEIFREAGYRTAGVWRNGWVANNFGFDQGFDLYVRPRQVRPEHKVSRPPPGLRTLPGTDMDATLSAIEFLTGSVNDPFFLYVHYMDVHQYLYTDLSPDYGTGISDFYDGSIFWTDYNIGRIMQTLQELKIIDKTLVVVVSDHGEAFFEHGIEGHARNLYREVLDTPWMIFLPWELEEGVVVDQRVANVDVWPTILDLVGLPALPGAEGQSAVSLILAEAEARSGVEETDRPLYSQLDRSWGKVGADPIPTTSMLKGAHRLNYSSVKPENLELYDRSVDPREQRNVVADHPELANELRAEVEAFLAQPKTNWDAAPEVELGEMHQAQLRALGYVIENPWKAKGKGGKPEVPESPAVEP